MMAPMEPHTTIARTLSQITIGAPKAIDALTMIPLLGGPHVEQLPRYLTLDDAIARAWTEVTEISDQGSVPQLTVVNRAPQPVFILDGEELLGAKQNRVVNLSILVPPQATLGIPVSCVEAGRWRARSRAFRASPRTQYSAGRAKRMAQVSMSMLRTGDRHADQADIWADIAAKSERMGVASRTSAMEEIFSAHEGFTERCVEGLSPEVGQCGALFLIDGRVVGLDLFDSAVTLRHLLPKLVRGAAVDALDQRDRRHVALPLQTKVAENFLETVESLPVHESPALGLGCDLRLTAAAISGAALAHDGALVHLAAYAC
jgi:hypothetical protein